jgi:DNA invertase Pin-like site-specific DNA recombinase
LTTYNETLYHGRVEGAMRQRQASDARTRTVSYIRVSTDKQADRGVSLEAQEAKVRAYAELYGLDLVDVIVDAGESAKSLDRPGLQRALGMLRSGQAEALLVVKLDRLTRSVRDLGELVERYFSKAALLSVGEQIDTRTAGGRLVLNVLASVSQWEREAIGERTAAAMAHKAERGEYIGGEPPFGYRVEDGRLVEHSEEQAIVREARALRADGLSLRAVAGRLHEMGHRSRVGRPFGPYQVARMMNA